MNRAFVAPLALFILLLAGVASVSPASAGERDCGESCTEMLGARVTQPRPVNFGLVCIYFTQQQRGPVVLTLFGADGEVIRRIPKVAEVTGKFCIGKQSWASRTSAMELCNQDDTRRAEGERLAAIIAAGRTPENEPVQLVRE